MIGAIKRYFKKRKANKLKEEVINSFILMSRLLDRMYESKATLNRQKMYQLEVLKDCENSFYPKKEFISCFEKNLHEERLFHTELIERMKERVKEIENEIENLFVQIKLCEQ